MVRPVRYCSTRVQICQWCVSLLCAEPIDLDQIVADVQMKIAGYVDSRHGPKADSYYRRLAARQLGVQESPGFFELIFQRSRVEDRTNRIQMLAAEIRSNELSNLNSQREFLERETMGRALKREGQPTTVSFGYRGRAKVEDLVNPKMVKYVNAINLNLLSGTSKSARPDEAERKALRLRILQEDKFRCQFCGARKELQVHHIIPISEFGSNHINNLITLCYTCHNKAHPDFTVTRNAT